MHYNDLQFISDLINYLKGKIKDVTIIFNGKRKFILFDPIELKDIDTIVDNYNYDDMKLKLHSNTLNFDRYSLEIYLTRKEVEEDDW